MPISLLFEGAAPALESEKTWPLKSWFCCLGTQIITKSFNFFDPQFSHL